MPKAQVANLIARVENGVDEFRNYLEKRGDNAKDKGENAKDRGEDAQASGRRSRQGATENQKTKATAKKSASARLTSTTPDTPRAAPTMRNARWLDGLFSACEPSRPPPRRKDHSSVAITATYTASDTAANTPNNCEICVAK